MLSKCRKGGKTKYILCIQMHKVSTKKLERRKNMLIFTMSMVKRHLEAHIDSEFCCTAYEAAKRDKKVRKRGDGASATLRARSLHASSSAPVLCLL